MAPNGNEKISSLSSIDDIEQHEELISDDWCDAPDEIDVIARQKKKQVFIDVTKALMVLGFSSWSNLQEGVEPNNPKEMKTKLNGILEQRRKDRRDYLALINATETLNVSLNQKISTVNDFANNKSRIASTNDDNTKKQKRTDDYNTMPSNFIRAHNYNIASNNGNHNKPNNDRNKILNRAKSPRRCKSTSSKKMIPKNSKKILEVRNSLSSSSSLQLSSIYIYNLNDLHRASTNEDDEDVESDQDEEEKVITWACSVLLEEFSRKCSLRHQNKVVNKRINHKLEALHRFKKFQEELRKEDAKKEAKGETIHKALESTKPEHDTHTNINDDANINENNSDSDENVAKSANENKVEVEKEELNNHKIQIVSLQDQIRKEKDRSHISMVSGRFVSDTEKDKIKEAKQILKRLDEEAEKIKNKKRKEEEKQRLVQLRKILRLNAEEQENDVINNNDTAEANEETDEGKDATEELLVLEAKANKVKTMWKKKPAAKSTLRNSRKDSWKGVRKSLGSVGGGAGKPSKLQTRSFNNSSKGEEHEFEEYVQEQVKRQGVVLTEEEEKMVQDAIARTLAEEKDSGVFLEDSEVEDDQEVDEVFA